MYPELRLENIYMFARYCSKHLCGLPRPEAGLSALRSVTDTLDGGREGVVNSRGTLTVHAERA